MTWGLGIRALVYLRRATIALERSATADETLAQIATDEHERKHRRPKGAYFDTFDREEAESRFLKEREARSLGIETYEQS